MKTLKFSKQTKLWGGLLLAAMLAIIISACAICTSNQASAEENVDPYAQDKCYIEKDITASSWATFNATFNYAFTKVSVNGLTDTTSLDSMPALTTQSMTMTATDGEVSDPVKKDSTSYAGISKFYQKTDFSFLTVETTATTNKFTHAGEYVYTVAETVNSGYTPESSAWTDITSTNIYTVKVYVKNDTGETSGLKIYGLTITKPDGTTKTDTVLYESSINLKQDLTIAKTVAGDYGDKTKEFDIVLTITNGNIKATDTIIAAVLDTDGSTPLYKITGTAEAGSASFTFKLKHGQELVFDGKSYTLGSDTFTTNKLDVATKYAYTETGVTNYQASAVTTCKLSTDRTSSFTKSIDKNLGITLSYNEDKTGNITPDEGISAYETYAAAVGSGTGNISTITNTYIDVTPTAFLLDNAPYILLIGIPIVACVLYVVIRARRRSKQNL